MIRTILFRKLDTAEWTEGVLHTFVGENAVIETSATGELNLIPVSPATLKFKVLTEQWIKMQIEAKQHAQAQSVLAHPGMIRR